MPRAYKDPNDPDGLDVKERAFVMAMIDKAHFNQGEAARIAGYGGNVGSCRTQGSTVAKRPKVKKALQREIALRNKRLRIDADWVLGRLISIEEEAITDNDKRKSRDQRLKTIEMIGRHVNVNAFRTQVGISGPRGGPVETVDLSSLTAEELEAYGRIAAKLFPQDDQGAEAEPDGL